MWTTAYLISQILTIIIYILLCLTYIERYRKQILITNIMSHVLQATAFILLKGHTGFFMNIFFLIRDGFFLHDSKNEKNEKITKRDIHILIIMMMIVLSFSIISYDSIYSIFSILATITGTVAIWQKNTRIYRFLGIICSMFWLIYHISLHSIVASILESILLITTIVGYLVELKRTKINLKVKYQG